jgi:transcriptional regulator with XRE-family HTH domain
MATSAQHVHKTANATLSPGHLSQATGMDRGFISRVLRGQRGITLDRAAELATAAGVTVDALVEYIRNRAAA